MHTIIEALLLRIHKPFRFKFTVCNTQAFLSFSTITAIFMESSSPEVAAQVTDNEAFSALLMAANVSRINHASENIWVLSNTMLNTLSLSPLMLEILQL